MNAADGLSMINLNRCTTAQLETMLEAGREVLECQAALAKTGDNIVGVLLPREETFYEFAHCPPGDVFDNETHSQFYYHAHRAGEHGHFHIFMREHGMPEDCRPAKQSEAGYMKERDDRLSHLVAISMDKLGQPIGLFTTNRWVTAENWYAAKDVCAMVDCFSIEHAKPSWPVNRWITAMLRLFRPQIEDILHERDAVVAKWRANHPDEDVFEDRNLDLPSAVEISIGYQIHSLDTALKDRRSKTIAKKQGSRPVMQMEINP